MRGRNQITPLFIELLIVVVLTLVNGLLAMSELAVVSSRAARLRVLAAEGSRGAVVALKLQENPGKFLSSVQIGITLVGVLSGAFSGATLGDRLGGWLLSVGATMLTDVQLRAVDALVGDWHGQGGAAVSSPLRYQRLIVTRHAGLLTAAAQPV